MDEYIERENIYPLAKKIVDEIASGNYHPGVFGLDILDWIDDLPTADVRPVVYCKDCRHRDPEDHKCDCGQLERAGCVFPVDDDYFCAYGERREKI